MKRALLERNVVVVLFVLVMIIFSMAKRDTTKLFEQNNIKNVTEVTPLVNRISASEKIPQQSSVLNAFKN